MRSSAVFKFFFSLGNFALCVVTKMCYTLKFTFKITVIVGVSSCFVPMDLSYSDDLYLFIPNEVNDYVCFKHFFIICWLLIESGYEKSEPGYELSGNERSMGMKQLVSIVRTYFFLQLF